MLPEIKSIGSSVNILVIHKIYLRLFQPTGHVSDSKYLAIIQCV